MHVGLTMFPTDYSIPPHDLAVAAEARGYESLWLPEHSHIPTSRKSPWPGGPELPKYYYARPDIGVCWLGVARDFQETPARCFLVAEISRRERQAEHLS